MPDRPTDRIASLLGAPVTEIEQMSGGDLSQVLAVTLADGRRAVAKTGPLVAAEAHMLAAIAATGAPAPEVLAAEGDLLVMERLPAASGASPEGWTALGRTLRRLHEAAGAGYGWAEHYAFGPVSIPNAAAADWPAFWAERRLMAAPGALPADIANRVEGLAARLPDLLPHSPPAALLHGDLWQGNVLFGTEGACWLIDPACYYGDAEVDLAMLKLFGRPGPAFQDGYGALSDGWLARLPIYQLWPALVHLRLFGGGYRGLVERLLSDAGA